MSAINTNTLDIKAFANSLSARDLILAWFSFCLVTSNLNILGWLWLDDETPCVPALVVGCCRLIRLALGGLNTTGVSDWQLDVCM
jgi:hypothetical protein